jgi:hypothetical protein
MTSYKFIPSNITAFSFQPTLDGVVYNIIVVWSLFGQRYYVNCYTNTGSLVFSLPLIGSLDGPEYSVNLAAGYFKSTLVYREKSQTFEVSP